MNTARPEQKKGEMDSNRGKSISTDQYSDFRFDLIRFGFRLLYNEMAFIYDPVSWIVSLGQWRDWQRTALPFIEGHRVLEIGHGPGHMLLELEQAGYQVVGLDLSSFMGRMAAKKLNNGKEDVSLVRGKAQELPFASASFSGALATFPTEFTLEPTTLEAVRRILVPGGQWVIVLGAELARRGVVSRIIDWLYLVTGQRVKRDGYSEHDPLQDLVSELVSSTGFEHRIEQVSVEGSLVMLLILRRR